PTSTSSPSFFQHTHNFNALKCRACNIAIRRTRNATTREVIAGGHLIECAETTSGKMESQEKYLTKLFGDVLSVRGQIGTNSTNITHLTGGNFPKQSTSTNIPPNAF